MIAFSRSFMYTLNLGEMDFSANIPRSPSEEQRDELIRYLQEIGQRPLLTAEQEQSLARCIQRGVAEHKHVHPDHQVIADGKQALSQLVEANYRLVVSVAQRYRNHSKGLTFLDLIQEGNIGLLRCAPNFDPERGYKFSTYAIWWIRAAVIHSIESADAIRLPMHISIQLRQLRQIRLRLLQTLGREPAIGELATATGLEEARIRALVPVSVAPLSLDQTYHTNDGEEPTTLGLQLADGNAKPLEESALQSVQESEVIALLRRILKPHEYQIVAAHYGLDGRPELTLEEMSQALNVTYKQIRLMERRAFAKLRRSRIIRTHYQTLTGFDQA